MYVSNVTAVHSYKTDIRYSVNTRTLYFTAAFIGNLPSWRSHKKGRFCSFIFLNAGFMPLCADFIFCRVEFFFLFLGFTWKLFFFNFMVWEQLLKLSFNCPFRIFAAVMDPFFTFLHQIPCHWEFVTVSKNFPSVSVILSCAHPRTFLVTHSISQETL